MSRNPPLVWTVVVTREHEDRWRSTLGQESLETWCAAHGWRAKDVLCDSVVIYGYADGRAYVNAELVERDARGNPVPDDERMSIRRRCVVMPLRQSLPEGIGEVAR